MNLTYNYRSQSPQDMKAQRLSTWLHLVNGLMCMIPSVVGMCMYSINFLCRCLNHDQPLSLISTIYYKTSLRARINARVHILASLPPISTELDLW